MKAEDFLANMDPQEKKMLSLAAQYWRRFKVIPRSGPHDTPERQIALMEHALKTNTPSPQLRKTPPGVIVD